MYIRAASYQIFELKTYRSETVDFRAVFVKHLFYTYPHMTFYLHTYPEFTPDFFSKTQNRCWFSNNILKMFPKFLFFGIFEIAPQFFIIAEIFIIIEFFLQGGTQKILSRGWESVFERFMAKGHNFCIFIGNWDLQMIICRAYVNFSSIPVSTLQEDPRGLVSASNGVW